LKFSLNELKIAVINKDLEKIEKLSQKEPECSSLEEMKEMVYFLQKASELLMNEKNKLSNEMDKLKKLKNYTS